MKFYASDIQLSASRGEYFQVSLSESNEETCSYVLLQNSFDFSREPAYFECHNFDLAGHGRLKRCELCKKSLEIDVTDSAEHITVTFNEPDATVGNLAWILRIIFAESVPFVNSSGISENPIKDPDFDEF